MPRCHETPRSAEFRGHVTPKGGPLHDYGFNTHVFEPEPQRCARNEAAQQEMSLPREAWGHTQTGRVCPLYGPRTLTNFRTKNYSYHEPWRVTIGESGFSEVRAPSTPPENVRNCSRGVTPRLQGHSRRRLDHAKPRVFTTPKPLAASEPFVDVAKYTVQGRDIPRGGRASSSLPWQLTRRKLRVAPEMLDHLRQKFNAAAYMGRSGKQLEALFRRLDKDSSGFLEEDEMLEAVRRILRVPPTMLSDQEVFSVFALLDADLSGSVSIDELMDFIGWQPHASSVPRPSSRATTTLP